MKALLRWQKRETHGNGQCWEAYCGNLRIAMVGDRNDGSCWYTVDAISVRWIAKGAGDVSSIAAAKRAVENAWQKWLSRAGLLDLVRASKGASSKSTNS